MLSPCTLSAFLLRTRSSTKPSCVARRVKSLFQIFEDGPLDFVLPILEGFIADKANRHKQRAAGELVGGALVVSLRLGHR